MHELWRWKRLRGVTQTETVEDHTIAVCCNFVQEGKNVCEVPVNFLPYKLGEIGLISSCWWEVSFICEANLLAAAQRV